MYEREQGRTPTPALAGLARPNRQPLGHVLLAAEPCYLEHHSLRKLRRHTRLTRLPLGDKTALLAGEMYRLADDNLHASAAGHEAAAVRADSLHTNKPHRDYRHVCARTNQGTRETSVTAVQLVVGRACALWTISIPSIAPHPTSLVRTPLSRCPPGDKPKRKYELSIVSKSL